MTARYYRFSRASLLVVLPLVGLFATTILLTAHWLSITVNDGWSYSIAYADLENVSGLVFDGETLYATLENRNHDGKLISITSGKRTVLESSLQKPDGLILWLGLPTYTQEFGQSFVYAFRNGKSEPIFATDGAEGIDAAENGDLFVVEDKPSGSLLKYSKKSGSVVALVDGLNQAEGVCVMDSGTIYYVEKSSDTVFQIVKGSIMPFVSGLTKPAYLHCDENRNGVWITEDRRHFGRLLFARVGGSFQIIATGLSSPQSLDFDDDGNLFLAEQGKNRILKFTPQDRYLASYGDL